MIAKQWQGVDAQAWIMPGVASEPLVYFQVATRRPVSNDSIAANANTNARRPARA